MLRGARSERLARGSSRRLGGLGCWLAWGISTPWLINGALGFFLVVLNYSRFQNTRVLLIGTFIEREPSALMLRALVVGRQWQFLGYIRGVLGWTMDSGWGRWEVLIRREKSHFVVFCRVSCPHVAFQDAVVEVVVEEEQIIVVVKHQTRIFGRSGGVFQITLAKAFFVHLWDHGNGRQLTRGSFWMAWVGSALVWGCMGSNLFDEPRTVRAESPVLGFLWQRLLSWDCAHISSTKRRGYFIGSTMFFLPEASSAVQIVEMSLPRSNLVASSFIRCAGMLSIMFQITRLEGPATSSPGFPFEICGCYRSDDVHFSAWTGYFDGVWNPRMRIAVSGWGGISMTYFAGNR